MDRRTAIKSSAATLGLAALFQAQPGFASSAKGHRGAGAAKIHKAYVEGPFGQLHYYRSGLGGSDGPPLVLMHQSPLSARQFEQVLPLLGAAGIDAIAMDMPGYGMSDVPNEPPSIGDYAKALGALVEGLGIGPTHILGHHTGAQTATAFAAAHPELVRSVILNSPPYFSDEDLVRLANFQHAPTEYSRDGSHLVAIFHRRAMYTPGWTDERVMHRRVVDQLWAGPEVWYGHHAAFTYDMRPVMASLEVPTLILTNSGDDIYDLSQVARTARPDFAYRELEGGTHDIVDEQPAAWAAAVTDWVQMQEA